jgi:D-alanyl-D-alanine carboxypeptidase
MLIAAVACTLAICACLVSCGVPSSDSTSATTAATTTTTVAVTTTTAIPTTTTQPLTKVTTSAGQTLYLDPTYTRLLLVNADHPIPADFNKDGDFASFEKKYINGSLNQIDKDVYPYAIALIEAAKKDGVTLYVRSPYRSYATQQMLFTNKVNAVIKAGTPADQAEAVAARAVARPGTSEHQTGLAIDFNVASSTFENSPGFTWMKEHAEDYGFILRYPKDKTQITGIMYEAWHWRFVGINAAKEINDLGMTLEEYLAYKEANN